MARFICNTIVLSFLISALSLTDGLFGARGMVVEIEGVRRATVGLEKRSVMGSLGGDLDYYVNVTLGGKSFRLVVDDNR